VTAARLIATTLEAGVAVDFGGARGTA